jgi:hypothetical protein
MPIRVHRERFVARTYHHSATSEKTGVVFVAGDCLDFFLPPQESVQSIDGC